MGQEPVSCPSCGHENPAGARFCNHCGAPLAAPAIPLEPRSYTPRHLADKILASRSALRGERKLVTVLFADVAGSMELAERVDPEEWHRLLDRLFRILADGVHRYEGTINQYTGDGIMAEHRYHERPSPRAPPPRAPLPLTSRPPPRAGFPLEPQAQPPIHGEARVPPPSLTEFLALLLARQRLFELRLYEREPPTHAEHDGPVAGVAG